MIRRLAKVSKLLLGRAMLKGLGFQLEGLSLSQDFVGNLFLPSPEPLKVFFGFPQIVW
jgi:hypothetical protein